MRILVLGAGGVGGYFGGRLAAAGVDVTFLVRPGRAAQLARDGLVIRSPLGDARVPAQVVMRETLGPGWGAILLSCKAFDLGDAIETIRPAAPGALIVPLLNGVRHFDPLDAAFGAAAVAGGVAQIGATLDADGTVRHLNRMQRLIVGARQETQRAACSALHAALQRGGFEARLSDDILLDLWEKFILLATLAGATCLFRADIGTIVGTDEGASQIREMLESCVAAATAAGHPPRERALTATRALLTETGSTLAASMLRDLRRGGRIEADHIIGDMLARARAAGAPAGLLAACHTQLQAYQLQRAGAP